MPHIDFTNVGWCRSCREGVHADCWLHINDGAVDALDFSNVDCECPCNGDVYKPDHYGLIELISELRHELEGARDEIVMYNITLADSEPQEGYEEELDLSSCPYFSGRGTCSFGCSDEPACMTSRPSDGWPGEEALIMELVDPLGQDSSWPG